MRPVSLDRDPFFDGIVYDESAARPARLTAGRVLDFQATSLVISDKRFFSKRLVAIAKLLSSPVPSVRTRLDRNIRHVGIHMRNGG